MNESKTDPSRPEQGQVLAIVVDVPEGTVAYLDTPARAAAWSRAMKALAVLGYRIEPIAARDLRRRRRPPGSRRPELPPPMLDLVDEVVASATTASAGCEAMDPATVRRALELKLITVERARELGLDTGDQRPEEVQS